ncbi:MAG: AMMECR1 family protein [Acidimicrobiia bacterium]|nr:AMMECR1 family protein [Acidimicrobiia bacterium]
MTAEEHRYVALARKAIRHYLATGEILDPGSRRDDPPPCGVFVSLHQTPPPGEADGPLRGCVGSYRPRERTLGREIAQSAVAAAVSDPRFPPLAPGEVDDLHVTVYLLGETEPVENLDELDPARFGVLVEGPGGRTGLLLPALPGITTVAQQVDLVLKKASFSPYDPIRLYRFPATIII